MGVIYEGRTEGMNPYKARFAAKTDARTLADAMRGADVFVGLSVANCVTRGNAAVDGAAADCFRAGQSRPGDSVRRGCEDAAGRHRRHRAAPTIRTR